MSYTKQIAIKDKKNKGSNVLDNSIIDTVFLKDYKKAYIYKKAEKLSRAVHVILNHVQISSEITDRLSALSLSLIREVLHNNGANEGSSTVLEIISVIQVAEVAGIIASSNAQLLVREYTYLLTTICDQEVHDIEIDTALEEDGKSFTRKAQRRSAEVKGSKQSKEVSDIRKGQPADRKGQIIEIIKDKGSVSIKDIAHIITDCSEKTIQRELNNLIQEGHVRKEGERRWSTYHLVF